MSNQMLGLSVCHGASGHISSFDADELSHRQIATGNHCYGYTAGAGKTTTLCVHFIFDTQGEIPYTPTPKKEFLLPRRPSSRSRPGGSTSPLAATAAGPAPI